MNETYKTYKHSPPHFFKSNQIYMITAATYNKLPLFKSEINKSFLLNIIINKFSLNKWKIDAYVILDNHYHLLVQSPEDSISLSKIINDIHKFSALEINRQEQTLGRKVWWNYWDSIITYEKSYYSRINYIHFNPVKHGYTNDPLTYAFSSYGEFYKSDQDRTVALINAYPFDKVKVNDDF